MTVYYWILIVALIQIAQAMILRVTGGSILGTLYFKVVPMLSGLFLLLYAVKMLKWI